VAEKLPKGVRRRGGVLWVSLSTPYVPLREVIAFVAVMNETIEPYLPGKRNSTARAYPPNEW